MGCNAEVRQYEIKTHVDIVYPDMNRACSNWAQEMCRFK